MDHDYIIIDEYHIWRAANIGEPEYEIEVIPYPAAPEVEPALVPPVSVPEPAPEKVPA